MNYDTIIVEMLSRIQALEGQVGELAEIIGRISDCSVNVETENVAKSEKITTATIREYIEQLKKNAMNSGEKCLTIKANDVHKALHLKSRFPMVCNAMRQCMSDTDEIVYETPSGYSSTLEITYHFEKVEDE